MASLETLLALEADEEDVLSFLDEFGGLLFRDEDAPGTYWGVLGPKSQAAEKFYVRLAWSVYPSAPPSVAFADSIGGRIDVAAAWPAIPGYRAGSWDICKPFT